jgi:hypothetical protein
MRKEDAVPVPKMLIPSSNMKERFCAQKNSFKSCQRWPMKMTDIRGVGVFWCRCSHVSMIEVPILPAILRIDDKKSQCNCNKDSQQAQTDLVLTHTLFYFLCDLSDAWTAVCSSVDLSILWLPLPSFSSLCYYALDTLLSWVCFGLVDVWGWYQKPLWVATISSTIILIISETINHTAASNAARSKHMNEKVHWASFNFFIHSLFRKSPHSPAPLACCTIIPCNHSWASIFLFLWSLVCLPMMLWSPAVD